MKNDILRGRVLDTEWTTWVLRGFACLTWRNKKFERTGLDEEAYERLMERLAPYIFAARLTR